MSTSRNTFNEVKGLLGRLERSIDEARTRRLGGPARPDVVVPPVAGTASPLDTVIGSRDDGTPLPPALPPHAQPPAAAPEPPSPTRAKYGRAKPLSRPPGANGFPGSWAG